MTLGQQERRYFLPRGAKILSAGDLRQTVVGLAIQYAFQLARGHRRAGGKQQDKQRKQKAWHGVRLLGGTILPPRA